MNNSQPRVCAAMITFHPDAGVVKRILGWLDEVPVLCVIDNGSPPEALMDIRDLAGQKRIVLMENSRNLGIATALNQALDFARARDCDWLLTSDQDSLPAPGYLNSQLAALAACPFADKVAVVGGRAVESALVGETIGPDAAIPTGSWRPGKIVITSGSLYRCAELVRLGGFRDDLFIDLVDTEYCLRLCRHGLRVIVCDQARFFHQYGRTSLQRLGPLHYVKRIYPPLRNYYRFRNGIVLVGEWWRLEPAWSLRRLVALGRMLMNIIVLHDRKAENLRLAARGLFDGLRRRGGPLKRSAKGVERIQ